MKKLLLLLAAVLSTSVMAHAVDYYLIGGFNGWSLKDASCKFTDKGDGIYELNYNGNVTNGFKINDGTWSGVDLGSNGNKIKVGVRYTLQTKGGNIEFSGVEGVADPKLTLNMSNPDAPTLIISGQQAEVEKGYALRGDFTGAWNDFPLAKQADGSWTTSVEVTQATASFGVMTTADGNQEDWMYAATGTTISGNAEIQLFVEDGTGSNMSITAGKYDFSFNPDNLMLTVVKEGEVVVEAQKFFLVGQFNGWATGDTNYQFEESDGTYTLTVASLQGTFKICGTDWSQPNYGSANTPAMGETTTFYLGGADSSFAEEVQDVTFTFSWTSGAQEIQVLVTSSTTGIDSVAAEAAEAVYYNLQGVRVAEPQSGIYVKVQAGKATKVAF